MNKSLKWDIFAWSLLCGFTMLLITCSPQAKAVSICRGAACNQRAVIKQVAFQQPVAYPSYLPLYAVGQQLRTEAVATYDFRQSPEYQELLDHRQWRAGFDAGRQLTMPQQQQPEQGTWGNPADQQQPVDQPPADDQQPPMPPEPIGDETAMPEPQPIYPTLQANCAKCHSGDEPKGNLWLDGSVDLRNDESALKLKHMMEKLVNGHMPPDSGGVDDETFTNIIYELYGEQSQEE